MKKLPLLVGAAVGFVIGSKMGPGPYERLETQIRQFARRAEVKDAVLAVTDKATELTDTMPGVVKKTSARKGPTGSIDQAEMDAETDAAIDIELEGTFPTSDPPSSWAGPDIEPDRPERPAKMTKLKQSRANAD
jgi:hypothetical protein